MLIKEGMRHTNKLYMDPPCPSSGGPAMSRYYVQRVLFREDNLEYPESNKADANWFLV